jgi:glycosyltransferase involved in cell wall biosynthesis
VHHGVTEEKETCFPERIGRQFDQEFLFTAGAIEAYRGLEDIIRAMTDPIMTARRLNLLIAGTARSGMKSYEVSLRKLVSSLGLEKSVHWLGQLNQHEMAWCYKNAKAFVMTSRIEACPNTALEAMVYGCPIVSTDAAPMPEMFGNAALYYSPGDIKGLARQVGRVLCATPEQEIKMKRASEERSKKFTWDNTAERTLEALKYTINVHGRGARPLG